MVTVGAIVASAAVPVFPDNLVVFPDRDFVTVEGYENRIGQTATLEVVRNGSVVGSAKRVVEAGGVAFEVNHPGGACWGDGTDLKVTPDIVPGDKVQISFAGEVVGDTTVQDAYVNTASQLGADGKTLTVRGYIAPGVNSAQMEQRIVNPDLTDLVGRRDVRAVPGALTPAPKGGYSSALAFDGDQFIATYIFDDATTAAVAAKGGGERAMTWEAEDAAANRQGLTIAEYGELGGPGMGGCPAGPADQAAPAPGSAAVVRSADKTSMVVNWSPATAQPGAVPVSGYSVQAVSTTNSALGNATVGRRTSAGATRTTISGLDTAVAYNVEVRSIASARMSEAFTIQAPAPPAPGDTIPPNVSATPPGGADSASAVEAKVLTLDSTDTTKPDIYFTTDGSDVLVAGLPSDSSQLYPLAGIAISKTSLVKWVAFDRAGNTTLGQGWYKLPTAPDPLPSAPYNVAGTPGQAALTLKWEQAGTAAGYSVQEYTLNADATTTAVGAAKPTTAKTLTISPATVGKDYYFKVKAKNAQGNWGPESNLAGPITPTKITDSIAITSAKWKTGDFRVIGTGSVVGAVVSVWPSTASGTIDKSKGTPIAQATVTTPVAPATLGDFDLRARNNLAPATNPGRVFVESNNGGRAGPFVVVNG